MKISNIILRILFGLLLVMPILGTFGIFPKPTADMYTSQIAYNFIMMLYDTQYILYLNAIVFIATLVLIIRNQMALASLIVFPITVNIIGFHGFLDGGLLTPGAVMGNILLAINLYFMWLNKDIYMSLLKKSHD